MHGPAWRSASEGGNGAGGREGYEGVGAGDCQEVVQELSFARFIQLIIGISFIADSLGWHDHFIRVHDAVLQV